MVDDSELEEGEARFSNVDDDENTHESNKEGDIDPEVDFSYIDEKIQNVLGHFQKDFEGGVSAENLGAKFGGYGSFLPTYERSPSLWLRTKTPQKSTPRSPKNVTLEAASRSMKGAPNVPQSVKIGIASHSSIALNNSGMTLVDVPVKHDFSPSSTQVLHRSTLVERTLNTSGNPSDQRPLRVRIKVVPDNVARDKAAIYSGLGLNDSPSSSIGNSPRENGGKLPVSQVRDESHTRILQIMTSFPVPEGAMISPLHENLLSLQTMEELFQDTEHLPPLKEEDSAPLVGNSISVQVNEKQSKLKKVKWPTKNESMLPQTHGNGVNLEMAPRSYAKKQLENDCLDRKEDLSSNILTSMPPSTRKFGCKLMKATSKPSKLQRDANELGIRDGLPFPDLLKEESLEPISSQDSGKCKKVNTYGSLGAKRSKGMGITQDKAVVIDQKDCGRCDNNKTCSNSYSDVSKYGEDLTAELRPSSILETERGATCHAQDESTIPSVKEKTVLAVRMKSEGVRSNKKATSISMKEMEVAVSASSMDLNSVAVKMQKVHSEGACKVRDRHRDHLVGKSEQGRAQNRSMGRASQNRPKGIGHKNLEGKCSSHFVKAKEKLNSKGINNHPLSGPSVKDATDDADPSVVENGLLPAQPVLVHEDWVSCDLCHKWRLLPYGMKPDQLPEKWMCRMLNWLPGMNRCDVEEDATTKALHALYQPPATLDGSSLQNHGNGTSSEQLSLQVLAENNQGRDPLASSSRARKRHGLKELAKAGSSKVLIQPLNSASSQLLNSVKTKSLNDMGQSVVEPCVMDKSGFDHLSKSDNSQKHVLEQRDHCTNRATGGAKHLRMKNKRKAEDPESETCKKSRTDNIQRRNVDAGTVKVGLNSQNCLLTEASGNNTQKSNEYSVLDDAKCANKGKLLLSLKKPGNQANGPSYHSSLYMGIGNNNNASMRKRNLKEWQQNQHDSKIDGEQNSEIGLKKQPRVSDSMSKELSTFCADDKINKMDRVGNILLSRGEDHLNRGMEDVRSTRENQEPQKRRKKSALCKVIDGADFSAGQVSMSATSSSSKISGSLKSRRNFDSAKGSPVESVSSSPLKTSLLEKHSSTSGCHSLENYEDLNVHPSLISGSSGEQASRHLNQDNLKSTKGARIENHLKPKGCHDSDANMNAPCSKSQGSSSQQQMIQVSECETKVGQMQEESINKIAQLLFSDWLVKRDEQRQQSSQLGETGDGRQIKASVNGDNSKSQPESIGIWNACDGSLGHHVSQAKGARDLDASSPVRTNPLIQTANDVLKAAKESKDYADRVKSSGFDFESNEEYFRSALRYLRGAFLQETCNREGGRQGELTQLQFYGTAAKISECCALEYERQHDVVAAALAYKCMEVAYWRIVYCKNSSLTRDRVELRANLQATQQGESPSSSASDIDNLNNQAMVDKSTISKGTVSHTAGNPVIIARNQPNFLRLLDFTQDVNSAMEASKKSLGAFSAANDASQEGKYREHVVSVKRVIDFSFHDVEGFIPLVEAAMKAISHSGFGDGGD